MNPKVAIVILVVIVVVFIVAMTTNLFPKEKADKNKPPPNWVQVMQKGLVYYKPLDLHDVSAQPGCTTPSTLVIGPGRTCTYTIKRSGIPARRLRVDSGPVNVTIYVNDKPQIQGVDPLKAFDVMSGGGRVDVACPGVFQCVLEPWSGS